MADIKTPLARGAFVQVFSPRAMKNKDGTLGKAKYSINFLFPPGSDLEPLKQACLDVVTAKFGSDKSKYPAAARNKDKVLPFKDCANYDYAGYEPGWTFITATSDSKPDIRYAKRGADGKLVRLVDEADLYSGCWVQGIVNPYWRKVAENPGISFGLQAVVMVREPTDDETSFIGGRTNVDAEFEGVDFGGGSAGASSADALFD